VWIGGGASRAEVHLVDHSASRASVQADEIVVAVGVDTGSHAMDTLHVFRFLNGTSTASVRHDTTLAELTVASVGGRAAHVECGRTSLILSVSVRLSVVEFLARAHTSDHILACFVLQSQINGVEVMHRSSVGDTGIEAVHREGVVLRAVSEVETRCVDHSDVRAVSTSIAVTLVALTPEVENVGQSVAVDLAGVEPGGITLTTPSRLEERVNGRSAPSRRASTFRIVRHLVSGDTVATLLVTTVLGPEASASKASRGDVVIGELARLHTPYCSGLTGDETADTRSSCLHPQCEVAAVLHSQVGCLPGRRSCGKNVNR